MHEHDDQTDFTMPGPHAAKADPDTVRADRPPQADPDAGGGSDLSAPHTPTDQPERAERTDLVYLRAVLVATHRANIRLDSAFAAAVLGTANFIVPILIRDGHAMRWSTVEFDILTAAAEHGASVEVVYVFAFADPAFRYAAGIPGQEPALPVVIVDAREGGLDVVALESVAHLPTSEREGDTPNGEPAGGEPAGGEPAEDGGRLPGSPDPLQDEQKPPPSEGTYRVALTVIDRSTPNTPPGAASVVVDLVADVRLNDRQMAGLVAQVQGSFERLAAKPSGWQPAGHGENGRQAAEQAKLNDALRLIRSCFPRAATVILETSDTSVGYGFRVIDVLDQDGQSLWASALMAVEQWMRDYVDPLLSGIDWDGIVGEDEHGIARITITDPHRAD